MKTNFEQHLEDFPWIKMNQVEQANKILKQINHRLKVKTSQLDLNRKVAKEKSSRASSKLGFKVLTCAHSDLHYLTSKIKISLN